MKRTDKVGWCLGLLGLSLGCFAGESTVNFNGTFVEEACSVAPGSEALTVDFGTVIDTYLYTNTRTHSQPVDIQLTDCQEGTFSSVSVRFTGATSDALPGYLALDGGSQGAGIAIGLTDLNGKLVAINSQDVVKKTISAGQMTLSAKAYVQGEPTALSQKGLRLGNFTATATYVLDYQ